MFGVFASVLGWSLACSGWTPEGRVEGALGPMPDVVDAQEDVSEGLSDYHIWVEARFVKPADGKAWFDALVLPCDQPTVETRGDRPDPLMATGLKSPRSPGGWRIKSCEPSKPFQDEHFVVAFDGTWVLVEWFTM
jgi:hypothetical protein